MKVLCSWLAVALVVATVGCNKGGPAGGVPATAETNLAPDVAITKAAKSISEGDAGAVWNAFPAKYQTDVTTVKNEFAGKMDPEVWNKTFVVLGKTATVLKTKKDMILNFPLLAMFVPPDAKEKLSKDWGALVSIVETLANSEIKTLDGLKKADVGRFLSSTGTTIGGHSVKAGKSYDQNVEGGLKMMSDTKWTVVKHEGDKATLKKESPGEEPENVEFVKIDGKWVPEFIAKDWDDGVAEAKQKLATLVIPPEEKAKALLSLANAETTLDKLAAAKDQEEFNKLVMESMQSLPIMPGGGAPGMSGPPPGGLPGAPGPGGAPPFGAPSGAPSSGPSLPLPTITPPKTP